MSFKKWCVVFLVFTLIAHAQNQSKPPVAVVGNEKISQDQFKERFEFTPQVGRHIKGQQELQKTKFLYALIAEKLWAQKARLKGIDKEPIIASTLRAIQKMFARDQLYKMKILSQVEISKSELAEGVEKELSKLTLEYIKANDTKEIKNLYFLLKNGYPFDSLLTERPEALEQHNYEELTYSEMNSDVADSVYSLKTHEFTKPIKIDTQWYIFYLKSKETQFFPSSSGKETLIKKVEESIRENKSAPLYKKYMQKMFVGREVKVDHKLFKYVSEQFSQVLKDKPQIYDTLFIDSNDAYYLINNIPQDTLLLPFIYIDNSPVNIENFICELAFIGFETSSYQEEILEKDLNRRIRKFIENEVLAREALKLGLDGLPEVEASIKMWSDYYLSYYYRSSFKDSVKITDTEVKKYAAELNKTPELRIEYNAIELLTDSLSLIQDAFSLTNELELRDFVVKHTKRERAKSNNGELGWFTADEFPEIATAADQITVGETFGPIQIGNDFSFIKLVGKRNGGMTYDPNNLKNMSKLRRELLENKFNQLLLNKTVEFANSMGFKINEAALENVSVTEINSYIIRLMGFGGNITAVPLSTPFYYWIELLNNSEKISL